MREIRTSGSVRGGGGNVPTYSAGLLAHKRDALPERCRFGKLGLLAEELQPSIGVQLKQPGQEQATEQRAQHTDR